MGKRIVLDNSIDGHFGFDPESGEMEAWAYGGDDVALYTLTPEEAVDLASKLLQYGTQNMHKEEK